MSKAVLKIAVVTGSRAEYGLLKPLLDAIRKDRSLKLQLLVTGMHLSPEFGLTYQQIEQDGYRIDEKVEMLLSGDTDSAIVKSTAIGMMGMADALLRLQPDWVVLLGDRFETFAAAFAAHQAKIPVAHLHGGELTEGATDDAMRHAITKMSYLHFTSTEIYRKRVIQLGESPNRVFTTGAIGLDSANKISLLSNKKLSKALGFNVTNKTVLVTYHPVTMEHQSAERQMKNLLRALDRFPDRKIIFTLPNADSDGRVIINLINEYVKGNPERTIVFSSLGQEKYLSALQFIEAVIGNSSSGIIEVPFFGKPTVNIGDRQRGRIRAASVIDTGIDTSSIIRGMQKAFSASFRIGLKNLKNPYGNGRATGKIVSAIKKTGHLSSTKKKFFDLRS